MTDNVKAMFEVEALVNASPATVSRAGIIYVSDTSAPRPRAPHARSHGRRSCVRVALLRGADDTT